MDEGEFKPGERVTYLWNPRGGYGYSIALRAEVIHVTAKRVRVRLWRMEHGAEVPVEKTVKPCYLRHTKAAHG